jgi:outer membrane protein assembly factor BamB
MHGATLENTHFQKMIGAMETAPYVKWSYVTSGWVECLGTAVANVDGVAGMEVVAAGYDRKVYCVDGVTGALKWSRGAGDMIEASPVVANVDGVAGMEVVIGSYDNKLYCLDGVSGTVKWSYVTGDDIYSSAVAANIDGVAGMEVVFGSYDSKVYCLDGMTGAVKWSRATGDMVVSSPAVANIDGIAGMEVVIGSTDYKVYCLDAVTGTVKWSYSTGNMIISSPAVANVDGVPGMEVVVGSRNHKVYCLDGVAGTVKWSYTTGGYVYSSPAVADLDDDGDVEVVIGSHDHKVYCLDGVTGSMQWSYNVGTHVHRGISVADIDGDISDECKLEVFVPNHEGSQLVCLNGEDGSVQWTKTLDYDVHEITIADIDLDGCLELVIGTQGSNKIWALDDVGNHTDCHCGPNSTEENSYEQSRNAGSHQNGIEFRATGKGIYFFSANAVQVEISVHDVSGRLEQVLYEGLLSKGSHTFTINEKSKGVYFAVLRTPEFRESLKIVRF